MVKVEERVQKYSQIFHKIKNDIEFAEKISLPGNAYFIENDDILTLPRDNGDSRYPYGSNGFNFWAYSSGYMHCNEGLFSPFLRAGEGQEPKIAFYVGIPKNENEYEIVPILPVPVMGDYEIAVERYAVFSKNSVYYITEMKDLRFSVRVFVNEKNNIYFTVSVENLTDKPKNLFVSSFLNPFLAHDIVENGEHRWFREVRYCNDTLNEGLGGFIVKTNEDISRTVSVSNYGLINRKFTPGEGSVLVSHEETTSRYQYVGGSRGSLYSPQALKKGTFGKGKHICAFTEVGAAGDILHINLGRKDAIRYDICLKYFVHSYKVIDNQFMLQDQVDIGTVDTMLKEIESDEIERHSSLTCKVWSQNASFISDNIFNSFIVHLKKQVEFCSLIKGYVQLSAGSLIGIRDVFQAIEGLLMWQPEAARRKMLESLNFIDPSGRCPRQYSLPQNESSMPVMDLRPFIDQGVWVISTIVSYLRYTGDFEFLNEECGYYEIIDEKKKIVKKSEIRDSVLSHMLRIMDYLIENRDLEKTLCIRALYGDWNDALDGLGVSMDGDKEYGSGVSVMATLQVYQNLHEMAELLERIDSQKYENLIRKYIKVADETEEGLRKHAVVNGEDGIKRIVHGWGDKKSYLVGGFKDVDEKSRYGLTSNAFWVLSKMYDKDISLKQTIMEAFAHLDSKYGLKTFEPHFETNSIGVGRIPKLPAGTAENGAAYVHASIFGIMALFRMGCAKEAWTQLDKSLPFTHEFVSCSPFVMPNSYGFNKEILIDGESMLDWQTGSSNVVLKLLIKYVFGVSPEFDGVWIQPAAWTPFEGFEICIKVKGCNLKITHSRLDSEKRLFIVNGKHRTGTYDEVMLLDKLWIGNDELISSELAIQVID